MAYLPGIDGDREDRRWQHVAANVARRSGDVYRDVKPDNVPSGPRAWPATASDGPFRAPDTSMRTSVDERHNAGDRERPPPGGAR